MKLAFFYCFPACSNCYLLMTGEGKAAKSAMIIDPGDLDCAMIDCIESGGYFLEGALVTHDHAKHVHGLRALRRIYPARTYALNGSVEDEETIQVKDGDKISVGPFEVEVVAIPGHSPDSAAYKIGGMLFTGDALTAGLVGSTASAYGAATQAGALRSRLLSLPGDYVLFPGHGPPSTLEAERCFNLGIARQGESSRRKRAFRVIA
ncbi:MAG: MBL fold metallo-hydrolase [Treponema sp.]|nr:MBL fold metallo-hydrolase [Treponema sp.]